jgi:hypothetical protein
MRNLNTQRRPVRDLPPAFSRAKTGTKWLFSGLLSALIFVTVCAPVLAQPLPPPGGGFGEFSRGIPVWWPYHVALMVAGFILLVAGLITAHYRKPRNWNKTHRILEAAGTGTIIIGIFVGIYMVTLSGFPHFANLHETGGITLGILLLAAVALGISITHVKKAIKTVRMSHRWLGRLLVLLILLNILLGAIMLRFLLIH